VEKEEIENGDILGRMQRNEKSSKEIVDKDRNKSIDELEGLRHLSIEYLMIHLLFEKEATADLLLLFLQKAPRDVEELLTAIRRRGMSGVQRILENGTLRTPLPTKDYYKQIVDAVVAERNKELATNLLRYLLFFPMKGTHETAIPYLIEQYGPASEFTKRQLINPYCWNATTIFLAGAEDIPKITPAATTARKMPVPKVITKGLRAVV
jgi:hypothetical protein